MTDDARDRHLAAHPPLARRHAADERRAADGRRPDRPRAERRHPGARPGIGAEAPRRVLPAQAEAALADACACRLARGGAGRGGRVPARHNLPRALRHGDDPRLSRDAVGARRARDVAAPQRRHDLNAVSHAFGGVAESGTLVLASGTDNPSTLNFLPDNHIVVIAAKDVAGDYEAVWQAARQIRQRPMPRTVNLITGPSRSGRHRADAFLGAHGPRRLHVLVVKG